MSRCSTKYAIIIASVIVANLTASAFGHIQLISPPARYDADYLTNFDQPQHCGPVKPSNGFSTTLRNGQDHNIQWRVSVAHVGGFSIDIIDDQGKVILTAVPQWAWADNQWQSQARINIPNTLTCTNCVLRLLQRSLEHGPTYNYISCSDISIVGS